MDIRDFKNLQEILLQIMDEIHRVCIKNNLRYYLIGGSALGAKRHNGIIPWDDDIDIAMPREDYQKFIHIYSQELNSKFMVLSPEIVKDFRFPHALVVLKDSMIAYKVEANRPEMKRYGIFVDILPLDCCPMDIRQQLRQENDLKKIKRIKYYKYFPIHEENSKFVVIVKKLIRALFSIYTINYLNRRQQRIMQRYNNNQDALCWCSMASHYSYKKLMMPIGYFGTPKLVDFSGRQYLVPERLEDYLVHLFGNYYELPSVEKQEAQINSIEYYSYDGKIVTANNE